jgi:tripartite-type tricarboxylate transporter receptor subunit TctC
MAQPINRRSVMKRLVSAVLAAALGLWASPIMAQTYPDHPVKMIVPFGAGGPVDVIARIVADKLNVLWNVPVIVDYKPGAGSVVGIDYVAKSPPDGYTIGVAITGLVINPSMRKEMPYDTVKDLAGISLVSVSPIVIVATNSLPANNLQELVAYGKANPGKLSYGTGGAGTALHMAGELLQNVAGFKMTHVPYRSSAAGYPDIISGRIELQIDPLYSSLQNIQSKLVKPIGLTTPKRAAMAPDIPSISETYPGYAVLSITGLVTARAVPRPIVEKISADVQKIMADPAMRERLTSVGMEPATMKPDEFDAFIKSEIEKWAPIVKASGASAD